MTAFSWKTYCRAIAGSAPRGTMVPAMLMLAPAGLHRRCWDLYLIKSSEPCAQQRPLSAVASPINAQVA